MIKVQTTTAVTHEVTIDPTGATVGGRVRMERDEVHRFRRLANGHWEQWNEQRGNWESFRYVMVEHLLDHVAGIEKVIVD